MVGIPTKIKWWVFRALLQPISLQFQLFFQPYCGHRFQPFSETVGKIELLNSELFVRNSLKNGWQPIKQQRTMPTYNYPNTIDNSNIIDLFNLMQNKYKIVQVQMTYH